MAVAMLPVFDALLPLVLKSAKAGTLLELVETAAKLVALVRPLLTDAEWRQFAGALSGVSSSGGR